MRCSALLLTIVLCCTSLTVRAQQSTPIPHPDPEFGHYGYRHHELHRMGVIDKLMSQSGKTCCDGGKGGECRVPSIRFGKSGRQAYLDGHWCNIDVDVTVFTNIELPDGAFAVVCASKMQYYNSCPATYCAAEVPGI